MEKKFIQLKRNQDARVRSGHLWIFSNEIASSAHDYEAGDAVEVLSASGQSFGTALVNPNCLIAGRLLGTDEREIGEEFFVQRLESAKKYRERVLPNENSYRLAFGESDQLPGLVIDRYSDERTSDDYFALQTLSAGMARREIEIVAALRRVFPNTKGIIAKNASQLRGLEGLPMEEKVLWGEISDEIIMKENGISLKVSPNGSQKTGYFLDQKMNRSEVMRLSKGLRVLDCFTNQGGFALHAAAGGAISSLGVDISQSAVDAATRNSILNNFSNCRFEKHDVFEYLQQLVQAQSGHTKRENAPFDMIVLDPPAFAKSRKTVPPAKRGYAKINRAALELLPSGGLLVSASCSHHVYEETFLDIIVEQALLANRSMRLVFRGLQSPDHPIHYAMPETKYLKFYIFEIM